MGNASSSETPLRYSQRLSRNKLPRQASESTPALHDLPDDIPPVDSTRYSRFYLSASIPPSPYTSDFSQGGAHTPPSHGTPQRYRPPRRDSEPLARLMNYSSPSLATIPKTKRQSSALTVQTMHLPTSASASSIPGMRHRSESFSIYQNGDRSPIREYNPYNDELLRVASDMHSDSLPISPTRPDHLDRLESYESCYTSAPSWSYGDDRNAEQSMYVPLRRRSTNRVPGIATRLPKEDVPMPPPLFLPVQSNEPETPDSVELLAPQVQIDQPEERVECVESPELLPVPRFVQDQERARTPSAGEYGQLGDIKFGGLRIMNGSPVPSFRSSSGGSSRLRYSVGRDGYSTPPTQQHDIRRHSGLMQEILVDDPSFSPLDPSTPQQQSPLSKPTQKQSPQGSPEREYKQLRPDAIARLEGTDEDDVSRSESGVDSTSSSSSQSRLSKRDSGYGSNLSLASFKLGRGRRSSSNADYKSDTSTDSVPEMQHLKANKRSSWLAVGNKTRSFVISPQQRRKSNTALDMQFPRAPPKIFLSNGAHDNFISVPAIPVRVERSLKQHNGEFPTNTRRLTLRNEPSKESLNTIMSIESVEAPAPIQVPKEQPAVNSDKSDRNSAQALSRLPSFVRDSMPKSWLADPGKPITRKPVNSKPKDARLSLPSRPTFSGDDYKASLAKVSPTTRYSRGTVHSSPVNKQPSAIAHQKPRRRVSVENYDDSNKDLHCVASMEDMITQLQSGNTTPAPIKTGRPRHSLPAPSTRMTTHEDMRNELHFGFEEKHGQDMGRSWNVDQDDAPQRSRLPPYVTYRA